MDLKRPRLWITLVVILEIISIVVGCTSANLPPKTAEIEPQNTGTLPVTNQTEPPQKLNPRPLKSHPLTSPARLLSLSSCKTPDLKIKLQPEFQLAGTTRARPMPATSKTEVIQAILASPTRARKLTRQKLGKPYPD